MSECPPRSYQQVVLDHGRNPRNFGTPETFDRAASGRTPGCGDDLTVFVAVARDAGSRLETVAFDGEGCAVSRASASLMTLALRNTPLDAANRLVAAAISFFEGERPADPALGECACFENIHRFPSRQRCALLPWRAMRDALSGDR
jgi:nitrogen fixation NifU-like protein